MSIPIALTYFIWVVNHQSHLAASVFVWAVNQSLSLNHILYCNTVFGHLSCDSSNAPCIISVKLSCKSKPFPKPYIVIVGHLSSETSKPFIIAGIVIPAHEHCRKLFALVVSSLCVNCCFYPNCILTQKCLWTLY